MHIVYRYHDMVDIAQLVEHRIVVPRAVGSNPTIHPMKFYDRDMAQLVAHSLWERGVVSSSLAIPTIFLENSFFVFVATKQSRKQNTLNAAAQAAPPFKSRSLHSFFKQKKQLPLILKVFACSKIQKGSFSN